MVYILNEKLLDDSINRIHSKIDIILDVVNDSKLKTEILNGKIAVLNAKLQSSIEKSGNEINLCKSYRVELTGKLDKHDDDIQTNTLCLANMKSRQRIINWIIMSFTGASITAICTKIFASFKYKGP